MTTKPKDGGPAKRWLLKKRGAWWRPDGCGYTNNLLQAGVYDQAEADKHHDWNRDSSDYDLTIPVPLEFAVAEFAGRGFTPEILEAVLLKVGVRWDHPAKPLAARSGVEMSDEAYRLKLAEETADSYAEEAKVLRAERDALRAKVFRCDLECAHCDGLAAERDALAAQVRELRVALGAADFFIQPEIRRGPAIVGWSQMRELVAKALGSPATPEET